MKGLLIKDIKLMKNQKSFFAAMGLVGMCFLFTQEKPYFVISYITIMFSMFTVTTLSYDEFDNGSAYLFTLPFSRKDYVKEKYLYGILTCVSGFVIVMILSAVVTVARGQELDLVTVGATGLSSMTICVLFLSLAIPVEIKFGVEKGRIGFMIILGAFFVGFFFLMKFVGNEGKLGFQKILASIEEMPGAAIVGIICLLWIVAGGISMILSMRLIEKKEY